MTTETIAVGAKNENIETPKHVYIIKYLNYQRIKVNNDLLAEIKKATDQNNQPYNLETSNITPNQLSQIRKLKDVLSDVEELKKEDNLYMYYIFILLNLTPNMIKNVTRLFIAKVYLTYQIKCLYNYLQIIHRNNYLDDLISILQNLHFQNTECLNIFIETIHLFFT